MTDLKATAIKAIESMPEDVDLDDIQEEIVFQAKILQGLKDVKNGRTKPLEQARQDLLGKK